MSKPSANGERDPRPSRQPGAKGLLAFPCLAKLMPWKVRRSGHPGPAGPADKTVDSPTAPAPVAVPQFTASERQFMLDLARRALERAATLGGELPTASTSDCPPRLLQPGACFVTLTRKGELRGCVGSLVAREPLCQAVATSALNAALADPRFPPVDADEVDQIRIEVSVLSEPKLLRFASPEELLRQLQPGRDGVVLRLGLRAATFLPKVWDQLADKAEFLNHLAEKAGCSPSAWRGKNASVSVYRVESFTENREV